MLTVDNFDIVRMIYQSEHATGDNLSTSGKKRDATNSKSQFGERHRQRKKGELLGTGDI